jgi:aminotransferase
MANRSIVSDRVARIGKSAIHEMTRLSRDVEDVAFLSWAKPTSGTPEHINAGAVEAIRGGLCGGYSGNAGLPELAGVALEHNLAVITDEAYEYFTFDGHEHFSIGSIPEMRGRVITCYTFTKTYAMTGWRIGYLHADEELIPQITKAHIPLAICAPVVSQYAALAALKGPQECVAEFREHYRSMRDLMCERLDQLPHAFQYAKPSGSYLMFPRILLDEGRDSAAFCKKLLREARVSTTPGSAFGPTGEGHLRLSFCVTEEEIDKAFDRMEQYFG